MRRTIKFDIYHIYRVKENGNAYVFATTDNLLADWTLIIIQTHIFHVSKNQNEKESDKKRTTKYTQKQATNQPTKTHQGPATL